MLYLNDKEKYPKAAAYIATLNEQYEEAQDMLRDEGLSWEQREAISRHHRVKAEKVITAGRLLYLLGIGGCKDDIDGVEYGRWEPARKKLKRTETENEN